MSYNGSGVFVINTSGQPVVSGTVISSTAFNSLTADLATGLTTALTKDGQTTPTNNIKLGGYKLVNVGNGTAATDAATIGQIQSNTAQYIAVSGADTITGSLTPSLTSYTTGAVFTFKAAGTNTTSVTLNIDGLGAKAVNLRGTTALTAGMLVAGQMVSVAYDGTQFQLLTEAKQINATTANGILRFDATNNYAVADANLTWDGTTFTNNATTVTQNSTTTTITSPTFDVNASTRIKLNGPIGLGAIPNFGSAGQVLTSNGSSIAPSWANLVQSIGGDPRSVLTTKVVTLGGNATSNLIGSVYLSATTQMLVTSVSGSLGVYAFIYDSSTDTMGSAVQISTITNALPRFYVISSTSVLCYASGGVRVLTISGTTITANTNYSSGLSGGISEIVPFGSAYVIYGYNASLLPCLVAFTVSGTVLTFGSVVSFSATTAGTITTGSIYSFSSTAGLVYYVTGTANLTVAGFTISGTTITAGPEGVMGSTDTNTFVKGFFPTTGGRVLALLAQGASGAYQARAVVSSISGSTLTNSTVSTSQAYFSSSLAGSCFVQSGSAVLVVGKGQSGSSWYSVVLYDNAATATASTEVLAGAATSIYAAILTSATTIGFASTGTNGNWTDISIVANAPSFTTTTGSLYTIAPSNIGYYTADSGVSKYAVANGSNFYNVCTGASGYRYIYQTAVGTNFGSAVKTTGVTSVFLSSYYGNGFIDPTDAAKCWIFNNNNSTTASTFYRMQFV